MKTIQLVAIVLITVGFAGGIPAPGDFVGVLFEVSQEEVNSYIGTVEDITDRFICLNCTHVIYGDPDIECVVVDEYCPARHMCFNFDDVIQIWTYGTINDAAPI